MNDEKMLKHIFLKEELLTILENALNKTLGEIDIKDDFSRTINNPKITGIVGDVIEHSLLGYPSDTRQEPDIVVDGELVEVKTTGIRYSKSEAKNGKLLYEAKEPMSITAVSPDKIVKETFDESSFWHKLRNMLLIYYHYNSDKTVTAAEYADFYLKGFEFHKFSDEDKMRLMCDWLIVKEFIKELQKDYDDPTTQYPRISHDLRDKLVYIDTAPKWPNPPRFRLKRNFVTKIVRNHFGESLEQLPQQYNSYSDLDKKCNELVIENQGLSVYDLLVKYNIPFVDKTKVSKSVCEKIIIKMFGGTASSLNKIEMFNDFNIIGKSIVLTKNGARTEDMKLFPINFGEWCDTAIKFDESLAYDFFMNHQLLCIIFKETKDNTTKDDFYLNEFIGFKRISFDEAFIYENVLPVWNEIRNLINNDLLEETIYYKKGTNIPIINPCGTIKTQLNFPKSKDNLIFVRGTGKDSTKKIHSINSIKMYQQYIWIKGSYVVEKLKYKKEV